jgi:hypothetical protein
MQKKEKSIVLKCAKIDPHNARNSIGCLNVELDGALHMETISDTFFKDQIINQMP